MKAATGNFTHIYTSERYTSRRKIHSDYDSFWKSLNAFQEKNKLWYFTESIKENLWKKYQVKKEINIKKDTGFLTILKEIF